MVLTKNKYHISLLLIILYLLIPLLSFGQRDDVKTFIHKRKISIQNSTSFTYLSEIDSDIQNDLFKQGQKMLQIYLVRHAKPDINKPFFSNTKKTANYVNNYNSVEIQSFDTGTISLQLNNTHVIQCSPLRRAQETAKNIFKNDFTYKTDSVYREFETRIIKAPNFIFLPTSFWQALSRLCWILGTNKKGIESHRQALQRASIAASKLIANTKKEETSILIAHGMLNRSIKKILHKKGWTVIQNNGKENLGATILVKVVNL